MKKLRSTAYFLPIILIGLAVCFIYWKNSILIVEPDSGGYMFPAFKQMATGEITVANSRTFVYPFILYILLCLNNSIQTVTLFQGFFLMAAISFSTWQLHKVFCHLVEKAWVVLGFTYSYFLVSLVTASSWVYAQSILTEGIVIPLKIIAMSILLRGLADRKLGPTELVGYSVCLILIFPLLSTIRAHDYIFVIFSAVTWMFVIFRNRARYKLIFLAAFVVVVLIGMVGSQSFQRHLYISSGGSEVDIFGVKSLYCNNLKIINRYEADVAIKNRADFLISLGPQGWDRNEFNGDTCYYDTSLNALVNEKFPSNRDKFQYYKSMILLSLGDDPLSWVRRFSNQVWFVHLRPLFILNDSVSGNFPNIAEYRKVAEQNLLSIDFGHRYEKSVTVGSQKVLIVVEKLYWMVQSVILVCFIFSMREKNKSLFILWLWINSLLLSNLGVVGLAHTFDVSRYQHANVPLYLMATFVFLAVSVRAISNIIKKTFARKLRSK